jgi:hypothetical protein
MARHPQRRRRCHHSRRDADGCDHAGRRQCHTLHAKLTAATLADNASKAAHADLNNAIAASKTNARLLAQRIEKSTAYTEVVGKQLNIIGAEDTTDMTQNSPPCLPTSNPAAWWKLISTKWMPRASTFTA